MNSKTEVWQKRVHSLIPPYLSLSLLIAFSSPALTAHSANTNYQSRILGQQSLGFAGAYTAIAQDPSALYYNPAGLTQAGFSQLGTTLPVYGVEIHWHRQGLRLPYTESTQDLYQENYVNTTASIGLVSQFGTRDRNHNFRWGAGILISVPWNQRLRSQQSIKENSQDYTLFTHKQEEQTWLFGPGFAFRWKALSIGLSLFFSYDSFDSLLSGRRRKKMRSATV